MSDATNDLQERALQLLSEFAERFSCIKAVHLFGSVARGATDAANDVDVFFEYADDMKFSTAQVAAFTSFQDELERWRLSASQTLGKPVKPCCTYYGQRDEDIWQAIKDTPPIAARGKAFIVPTSAVAKERAPATNDAARYSAACHEAGHAIVAWSFGLQVGAAQVHDDGAGGVKISPADHLPLVDQLAIRLGGHQGQALAGCPIFDRQSFRDHVAVERILTEHGIAEDAEAVRLRDGARGKAYDILTLHRDTLINIASELALSGQLSAERMADFLGSPKA